MVSTCMSLGTAVVLTAEGASSQQQSDGRDLQGKKRRCVLNSPRDETEMPCDSVAGKPKAIPRNVLEMRETIAEPANKTNALVTSKGNSCH